MNRFVLIRSIFSGDRNVSNHFLRNTINNANKINKTPSKPQNPTTTTCGYGCGCLGIHPLFLVENSKHKTPNPHTPNPHIPNLKIPNPHTVWKRKPRLTSKQMFPNFLVIVRNNTNKNKFEGPFVGFSGLSASIVTLITGGHFVYDKKN